MTKDMPIVAESMLKTAESYFYVSVTEQSLPGREGNNPYWGLFWWNTLEIRTLVKLLKWGFQIEMNLSGSEVSLWSKLLTHWLNRKPTHSESMKAWLLFNSTALKGNGDIQIELKYAVKVSLMIQSV